MPRLTTYQYTQVLKTELITLRVGEQQEPIPVHKGFVVYYSEFFAVRTLQWDPRHSRFLWHKLTFAACALGVNQQVWFRGYRSHRNAL